MFALNIFFLSDENKNMSEEANSISKEAISDVPYREVPQVTPLQRAFQPASTPEHLTHRFMVSILFTYFINQCEHEIFFSFFCSEMTQDEFCLK